MSHIFSRGQSGWFIVPGLKPRIQAAGLRPGQVTPTGFGERYMGVRTINRLPLRGLNLRAAAERAINRLPLRGQKRCE